MNQYVLSVTPLIDTTDLINKTFNLTLPIVGLTIILAMLKLIISTFLSTLHNKEYHDMKRLEKIRSDFEPSLIKIYQNEFEELKKVVHNDKVLSTTNIRKLQEFSKRDDLKDLVLTRAKNRIKTTTRENELRLIMVHAYEDLIIKHCSN